MNKNLIAVCTVFFAMLTLFAAPVSAATYSSPCDMKEVWDETGYPDYVCGVWSESGDENELCIGILPGEAGANGKNEITEMLEHPEQVTFVEQTFSHSRLYAIMDSLNAYWQEHKVADCFTAGIDDIGNCIRVGCNLETPSDALLKMISDFSGYDNAVIFEQGVPVYPSVWNGSDTADAPTPDEFTNPAVFVEPDSIPEGTASGETFELMTEAAIAADNDSEIPEAAEADLYTIGTVPAAMEIGALEIADVSENNRNTVLISLFCGFAVLISAVSGWLVFRRRRAAYAASHNTVISQKKLTSSQVRQAVREQTPEFPAELRERILRSRKK